MDVIQEKVNKALEMKLDEVIEGKGADGIYDEIETLHKLKIESEKLDQTEREQNSQREEHRKDRIVNVLTQAGLAVGGWFCYDIWHRRGLKFEETGAVVSQWTRNLMSKMLPKK